jgi:hypothetical protein
MFIVSEWDLATTRQTRHPDPKDEGLAISSLTAFTGRVIELGSEL